MSEFDYSHLIVLPGGAFTKPGVRGFPGLEPEQRLLIEVLAKFELNADKTFLDLSARGGSLALFLAQFGLNVFALETSASANLALSETAKQNPNINVPMGSGPMGVWSWFSGAIKKQFDFVSVVLPGERGNLLVRHMLKLAFLYVRDGGACFIAGDKGKGFERYAKEAIALFGEGELLARDASRRVMVLKKKNSSLENEIFSAQDFILESRGHSLNFAAYPGVFSAGKLDVASNVLLRYLPNAAGLSVLDLGCGYGTLALFLASDGAASVCMLDDDVFSVESARRTLQLNSNKFDQVQVWYSDVDSALKDLGEELTQRNSGGELTQRNLSGELVAHNKLAIQKFDLVVSNPPFHVGKDLTLAVSQEFIRVAGQRLRPGGEFWLVANHFLPYEAAMRHIGPVREVARESGFKVLVASKTN